MHARCAVEYGSSIVQSFTYGLGPIVDTWVVDDKPGRNSAKILVSEIASIEAVKQQLSRMSGGKAFENCMIPGFGVTLRGGKRYACGRIHTASLIGAEEKKWGDGGGGCWIPQEQPAGSPSVVATEKFRDDLIIAWAEAIKSKRPGTP